MAGPPPHAANPIHPPTRRPGSIKVPRSPDWAEKWRTVCLTREPLNFRVVPSCHRGKRGQVLVVSIYPVCQCASVPVCPGLPYWKIYFFLSFLRPNIILCTFPPPGARTSFSTHHTHMPPRYDGSVPRYDRGARRCLN